MNTMGNFIRRIREEKGMSLREFADFLGLSHNYIGNLEKGEDPRNNKPIAPTIDTFIKIAGALKISLEETLKQTGYIEEINLKTIEEIYQEQTVREYNELIKTLDVSEIEAIKEIKQQGLSLVEVNKALRSLLVKK